MTRSKLIIALGLGLASLGAAAFAPQQKLAAVSLEIQQRRLAQEPLTTIAKDALKAGLSSDVVALALLTEGVPADLAVTAMVEAGFDTKVVLAQVAALAGVTPASLQAAAVKGGADPSTTLTATSSGTPAAVESGQEAAPARDTSTNFSATPGSSISGGGGGAASRS